MDDISNTGVVSSSLQIEEVLNRIEHYIQVYKVNGNSQNLTTLMQMLGRLHDVCDLSLLHIEANDTIEKVKKVADLDRSKISEIRGHLNEVQKVIGRRKS